VDAPRAGVVIASARIRVLHVITDLGIGGAERLVVSAATRLAPSRFDHAICCLVERGPLAAEANAAGVPVFCVGGYPGVSHPFTFARLVRIIRRFQPTIVHTHLQSANLYGRLAARLAGAPVVIATEHNVYVDKPRRYIAVERRLARRTDALIAVSEEVRRVLSRQLAIEPSAIRVVRNGVRPTAPSPQRVAAWRTRLESRRGTICVGTVASLTPKKGHAYLLRAVGRLKNVGLDCSLALAGDGPERPRLEALSAQLGLEDRVHFLGVVRDAGDLVAAVDVFALPSLGEGLPLALLEAMHAGKPVVATAVGGVPELITSGVNGLLVARASETELADAIAELARSPELCARLGAAGRSTVEHAYSESAYLESLSSIYVELTRPCAPGREIAAGCDAGWNR
jgi:glycosyltransferase involved in cell wall biosynthesis